MRERWAVYLDGNTGNDPRQQNINCEYRDLYGVCKNPCERCTGMKPSEMQAEPGPECIVYGT